MSGVSLQDVEPIIGNQKRSASAFLFTTFNAKSFIKEVQEELERIALVLADSDEDAITIDGVTFDDKFSQGALLAVTNFTSTQQSVLEGYNGLVSSLDNVTQQVRQLVRA